jgi:putative tricarboxylic transport membrane protein
LKLTLQAWMSLGVMIASAYTVITALKWPSQSALFPLSLGIVIFFMALTVFILEQLGSRKEDHGGDGSPVDFKLSHSENQALANKRTFEIFLWIVGFPLLILLVGFPLSIPIYFIAFLRFKCKENWRITIILSGVAWAFFYGLFISLLNTFFVEGWIQRGLSFLGILS